MKERKICIVSYETRTNTATYRIAHRNHEQYAKSQSYSYFEVNNLSKYPSKDHPQWHKFDVIGEAVSKHPDCDYFLFVDMDVYFTNFNKRIEDFIPSEEAQVCVSKDCVGGRTPLYDYGYCNGVILFKNTQLVREYFNELTQPWVYELGVKLMGAKLVNWRDQPMMQFLNKVGKYSNIITEVSPKSFHGMIHKPNFHENAWRKGDFILHLASYDEARRMAILNEVGFSQETGEVGTK